MLCCVQHLEQQNAVYVCVLCVCARLCTWALLYIALPESAPSTTLISRSRTMGVQSSTGM